MDGHEKLSRMLADRDDQIMRLRESGAEPVEIALAHRISVADVEIVLRVRAWEESLDPVWGLPAGAVPEIPPEVLDTLQDKPIVRLADGTARELTRGEIDGREELPHGAELESTMDPAWVMTPEWLAEIAEASGSDVWGSGDPRLLRLATAYACLWRDIRKLKLLALSRPGGKFLLRLLDRHPVEWPDLAPLRDAREDRESGADVV